jgi:hypothetical protein
MYISRPGQGFQGARPTGTIAAIPGPFCSTERLEGRENREHDPQPGSAHPLMCSGTRQLSCLLLG